MSIVIRDAVAEDAECGSRVLRRSIAELCIADHKNDPKKSSLEITGELKAQ